MDFLPRLVVLDRLGRRSAKELERLAIDLCVRLGNCGFEVHLVLSQMLSIVNY